MQAKNPAREENFNEYAPAISSRHKPNNATRSNAAARFPSRKGSAFKFRLSKKTPNHTILVDRPANFDGYALGLLPSHGIVRHSMACYDASSRHVSRKTHQFPSRQIN